MQKTILSLSVIVALFAAGCGDTPPPPAKQIQVKISATDGGDIDLLSGKFSVGSKITITAKPWEGSKFLRWEIGPAGSNKEQSTQNPLVYTVPEQDTEIKGFFRRLTVQLSASPGGKATTISESFEGGYYITVEANPDPHYDFTGWSDGSKENPRKVKITTEDVPLKAEFKRYPDSRLTDMLSAKIKIVGGGSYDWKLTKNTYDGKYTFDITSKNNANWVYVEYRGGKNNVWEAENKFTIQQLTPATKSLHPYTITFSDQFWYIKGYENVYLTTLKKDLDFPAGMVKNIEKSLEMMKIYGFHLDDLKIILPKENGKFIASVIGSNTILYNYVRLRELEIETGRFYNWDLSFPTWVHELFHIIDGRLKGISHKKVWRDQYEAAKKRQKEAKNYAIPNTGCKGIKNDDRHYELTTPFEFFAVVMTARVNHCKANTLCTQSPGKNCYFGDEWSKTPSRLENEQQLKALLPEAYKLATKLLEKGLPAASG